MRRTTCLVLTLGLALGGGAAWLARGAGAGPQDAPGAAFGARVAVVDAFALLNVAPRKRQIEQGRREGRAAVEAYVTEQRGKLRDLAGEIEMLPQADPRRPKLQEDFARRQSMLEFEAKWRVSQADEAYSNDLEALYAEVRAIVREVAQQAGYALVLLKNDERLQLERSAEFGLTVAIRPVLYADNAVDITNLVKARLEASRPPAPPAAPPAAPPVGPAMR